MFEGWDSFYLVIGGGAAGLIGLLFVVVTLTAGYERDQALRGTTLYMTPTMIHFAVVLASSALALAPRLPVPETAAVFAGLALVGLGNAIRACVGIRSFKGETGAPHWSDFWLYGVAAAAIYLGLLGADIALWARAEWAAHALAALLLALLLLGIRNAWDLVTWMAPKGKG